MTNIIEAIKEIYPNINGGYMYWETQKDGTPWENPIDGLVWGNTEYTKPTWSQIISKFIIIKRQELIIKIKLEAKKRIENVYPVHTQRNILMSANAPAIAEMNTNILAIRNLSNDLEDSLDSMSLNQLEAFDASDSENWS